MKSTATIETVGPAYAPVSGEFSAKGTFEAWHSHEADDPRWDGFLESIAQGQFQQSSSWREYKETQGWHACRVVLTSEGQIVGGWQILWKPTRLGRIGYASKGPVAGLDDDVLVASLVRLLHSQATRLQLQALIIQPPDFSLPISEALSQTGCFPTRSLNIIGASCMLDLTQPSRTLDESFSASLRRNLRAASKAGVAVREGTGDDIPRFYDLMAATCFRKGVTPNPPTAAATKSLWTFMSRRGHARLMFGVCRGEVVSGLLLILFGNRCSVFKVGWNGRHPKSHPNEMLVFKALQWAESNGYALADWVGISREAALASLEGKSLDRVEIRSTDRFIMRFGGRPILLPSPMLWIRNPLLRKCYRFVEPVISAAKSRRIHGPRN